jgi:hypothetical protein
LRVAGLEYDLAATEPQERMDLSGRQLNDPAVKELAAQARLLPPVHWLIPETTVFVRVLPPSKLVLTALPAPPGPIEAATMF